MSDLKSSYYRLFWFQRILRNQLYFRHKVRKLIRQHPEVKNAEKDKAYLKEAQMVLKKYFNRYTSTNWHHYYASLNGIKSPLYIPHELFYPLIEPTLNKHKLEPAVTDKNNYDVYFTVSDLPVTLFKLVNGSFFNRHNQWISAAAALKTISGLNEVLVLKPAILSGAGRNIVVETADKIAHELQKDRYKKGSYTIQKPILQHETVAQFHPSSVNTCRILTARIDGQIVVLSSFLRMGTGNKTVDNITAGGIACGINKEGCLSDYAVDKNGIKLYEHPDSGVRFKRVLLPEFEQVKTFCTENHKKFIHFTLISWDIAIGPTGKPVCVEINLRNQSTWAHQVLNGPLFGEYTEFLLKKYRSDFKNNFFYL